MAMQQVVVAMYRLEVVLPKLVFLKIVRAEKVILPVARMATVIKILSVLALHRDRWRTCVGDRM